MNAEHLERARKLTREVILVDTHIDVPYRLSSFFEDVTQATAAGDFDYPRAIAGGLDAAFMSIYIPSEMQGSGKELSYADSLIDSVDRLIEQHPDKFAAARTPEDIRTNAARGLISFPLGMENGAAIRPDLANLQHFYDRGIRYVTLAHGKDNDFSDSSYDSTRTWGGLSPAGEQLVSGMNRLGMMVDVSHLSDSAFYDVLRVSKAPVIATHSSARHFTPGWERNMDDAMIRALAERGGMVMVTFGSGFLRSAYQAEGRKRREEIEAKLRAAGLDPASPEGQAAFAREHRSVTIGTVADVADHIDHIARLVGIDHVGLGSDFDGVFALPAGLQDVSMYPNLFAELLRRGYVEDDLRKIAGENLLKFWERVEQGRTSAP